MGCAFQTWPKSIKFVRGGKEQQQWALSKDSYKEELCLYSKTNEYKAPYRCSQGDWVCIKSGTIYFLLPMFFLLFLFSLFLIPFPMLFPFIIYLYFHHIFTIHFYLPPSFFDTLLPFTSKEDSGRNLLICDLYCSGHFLINAADKAIVYHLIQMQHATPGQKLPYCPLTSTSFRSELPLRIPQNTMIHFFSSLSGFFPWACGL